MKISNIRKLPDYLRRLRADVDSLHDFYLGVNHRVFANTKSIQDLKKLNTELENKITNLNLQIIELEHMVRISSIRQKSSGVPNKVKTQLFADNHLLDQFYLELENNLRGSESEIMQKQKPYIKRFSQAAIDYKKYPVVDLGSGRGEFLELLSQNKIRGIGVDLNETMVERMHKKGLEAVNNDAITYLRESKSSSLGGVVGFHIAEHIPFDQLIELVSEARRVLVPGGFLLLETPNPESLQVGAFTFHYDPSHLKPIPPALLEFTAKFRGFERTEIIRLAPEIDETEIKDLEKKDQHLADAYRRLFGPRDYALLAYK